MKVVFARVGFMKYYSGPKPGDEKPIGGGRHNTDKIGHEAFNFKSVDGALYGYFQPNMHEPFQIRLERIQKKFAGDRIDGVLVIWFATHPVEGGQVIVGWTKNATVFRSMQRPRPALARGDFSYNVQSRKADSVLLPISKRTFRLGHSLPRTKKGNPGQANTFYALDPKGNPKDCNDRLNSWIPTAIDFVMGYRGSRISNSEDELQEDAVTAEHTKGQGFTNDLQARLMIEAHAMARCERHYKKKKYKVEDTSKTKPYDFSISKGSIAQFVEVKGTQSLGNSIFLTKNEVDISLDSNHNCVLFIVHSLVLNKDKNGKATSIKSGSGIEVIRDPWKVDRKKLTPLAFSYSFEN